MKREEFKNSEIEYIPPRESDMKRDVFYNMCGSISSSLASAVLLLVVTRVSGAHNGGVFSIAFTTAQMLMMLGNYGMRTFQVSDVEPKYVFREYLWSRIITCVLMMFSALVICGISRYELEKSAIVIIVTFSRMIEALADVYEGRLHQCRYLEIAGKSLMLRTITYSVAFTISLLLTNDLLLSSLAMTCASILCLIGYTCRAQRKLCCAWKKSVGKNVMDLLKNCFPLFLSMFLLMYIVNAPKYAIDGSMPEAAQAIYSILYLPAQVITLFATFVFKPMTNGLTDAWEGKNFGRFYSAIAKVLLLIGFCTVVCMIVVYLIGIPILSFISDLELKTYRSSLVLIVFGGGFSAVTNMVTQALTIMRKQTQVMMCYLCVSAVATVLPYIMVSFGGILGATLSFVAVMCLLSVLLIINCARYRGG